MFGCGASVCVQVILDQAFFAPVFVGVRADPSALRLHCAALHLHCAAMQCTALHSVAPTLTCSLTQSANPDAALTTDLFDVR